MAKAFSIASWNVEHFGAIDKRRRKPRKDVGPIIDFIAEQRADVVAVYEVVSSVVYDEISRKMPDYNFHITEGPQAQEILVGAKRTLPSFFTQKTEFQSGQTTLRPGALLTVKAHGKTYPLLFLHLKSLTQPKGFGLRDDMTERAIDFRRVLDRKADGGKANFIFAGDLNTMGMNLTYNDKDISGEEEIERLRRRAARKALAVLSKSGPTFWPGSGSRYSPSDLDHLVAADHLRFRSFGGHSIDLRGWPNEPTDAAKDRWVRNYSDHALLYAEVQR